MQRRRSGGGASAAVDSGELLATKLAPPPLACGHIVRQRLLGRLDEGVLGEVTVVCAGPGTGKTSLVASWVAGRAPGSVAWLSLDGYDNDAGRFWAYLLGALRTTGSFTGDDPLPHVRPGRRVDDAFVRRVAAALAEIPEPIVLVLDDLHEITDPQVLRSLAFLVRHPVPNLRLLVTTRHDAALPLHRPRVREATLEIRAAELNFTACEAAKVLSGLDVLLTPGEADTVVERAEGWAAGVMLASRLLSRRGTTAGLEEFSGTERTVAEYLMIEVFDEMSPSMQRFLRYTCVADRLCGELADALTGETGGRRALEQLASSNALVVEMESRPGWFRLHGLLADLVRHQVEMETPQLFRRLHVRAAGWYAEQDAVLDAVAHAVAAHDWPLVGRLVVTRAGPRIVSVDRGALAGLLHRIPETELSGTAGLEMCAALIAYDRADYAAVGGRVARARALAVRQDPDLRGPIEILARSFDFALARARGDMATLVQVAEEVVTLLMEVSPAQLTRARQYRAIALNNAGVGLFWLGSLEPAESRLRSGMALAREAGAELTQLNASSHLALLKAEQGAPRDGRRQAEIALDLATRRGWRSVLQVVPAYVALAFTALDSADPVAAATAIADGFAAQRADPEPIQLSALRVAELRLLLARGEVDAARLLAERIDREIDVARAPPTLARWIAAARAELDAAVDPEAFLARSTVAGDDAAGVRICVAWTHLARRAPLAAEAVLAPLRRSAPDAGIAVEAWVITALVEDALRQNNRSVDALARAVALAEPENFRRPFLRAEHNAVAGVLERFQWLVPQQSPFVAGLLAELTSGGAVTAAPGESEELTERELDVLRYLPTMLRNHDIATEMYVSVNTVKTHLRSLYRKLGVTQRREAVDRARELGIL